jgi:hypothetical protein
MKIEVFVKKDEVITGQTIIGRPISDGVTTHYCTTHDTFKTEQVLTEESRKVLDEATKKAKEFNAKMVVYNLATFKGQLAAKLKGVKSPTWRIVE